jgi:hypothetical protein
MQPVTVVVLFIKLEHFSIMLTLFLHHNNNRHYRIHEVNIIQVKISQMISASSIRIDDNITEKSLTDSALKTSPLLTRSDSWEQQRRLVGGGSLSSKSMQKTSPLIAGSTAVWKL